MSLCDTCSNPGACCRNFELKAKHPETILLLQKGHKLEVLATCAEWGFPFIPTEHDGNFWHFKCTVLTSEGRCGDYENRPALCSNYVAGSDELCVEHIPETEEAA